MVNIKKIEDNKLFQDFQECLEKTSNCSVLVRVKQYIELPNEDETGDKLTSLVIDEHCFECENAPFPNGEYMYLDLTPHNDADCNNIISAWNIVLERGAARFARNLENDYFMFVELIHQDEKENLVYTISFVAPIFAAKKETGVVELVFNWANIHFSKETVDFVAIYDELEYEQEEERFAEERERGKQDEYDENSDIIGNDDFLL